MEAEMICPFISCKHNLLREMFLPGRELVINDYIRECGGCAREITGKEEQEGVAGMRRAATAQEVATIFGEDPNSIRYTEEKALEKIRRIIKKNKEKF